MVVDFFKQTWDQELRSTYLDERQRQRVVTVLDRIITDNASVLERYAQEQQLQAADLPKLVHSAIGCAEEFSGIQGADPSRVEENIEFLLWDLNWIRDGVYWQPEFAPVASPKMIGTPATILTPKGRRAIDEYRAAAGSVSLDVAASSPWFSNPDTYGSRRAYYEFASGRQ